MGARRRDLGDDSAEERDSERTDTDDTQSISTAEKGVMIVSTVLTGLLFAFAIWQAFAGMGPAVPEVEAVGVTRSPTGGVVYTLELRNPGETGLISATVEAACTEPPTELTFANVPAGGRREASVVCPRGTRSPEVSIVSWIER